MKKIGKILAAGVAISAGIAAVVYYFVKKQDEQIAEEDFDDFDDFTMIWERNRTVNR